MTKNEKQDVTILLAAIKKQNKNLNKRLSLFELNASKDAARCKNDVCKFVIVIDCVS